jgi:hypothetical protein
MTVEINRESREITNVMGWIDNEPAQLGEVAFCITDFSESILQIHYFSNLMNMNSIRIAVIRQYALNCHQEKENLLMWKSI